jgi:hypothetical protein
LAICSNVLLVKLSFFEFEIVFHTVARRSCKVAEESSNVFSIILKNPAKIQPFLTHHAMKFFIAK